MNKKTEQSRIAYNKIASDYATSPEGRYTQFHIKELSDTIDLNDGDVVLDVACGNGTLLRKLSRKADIQANGIDISENMVSVAKECCPNAHFKVGQCCPLEWGDKSIDIITVCCAFHHFDTPQEFANECKRVLKKNGAVYIADPNYGALVRFLANNFVFPLSRSGDIKVYSSKKLAAFFHNAGFKSVETYKKGSGLFLKAKK